MNPSTHDRWHLRSRAFTLAEVIITVGIAATAIVTIIGLLPYGLESMRQSAMVTAEARAVQSIIADYQMRDWSAVLEQQTSGAGELRHFDAQGYRVEKGDADSFLLAQVLVRDAPLLPGSGKTNPRLRSLIVRTSTRLSEADAFDEKQPFRQCQVILAQMDKRP